MRLDPRIALPVALTALAFLIPGGAATADPPARFACPDGFLLMSNAAQPSKDHNQDGFVCMKVTPGTITYHDDNCNCDAVVPSVNPDDYIDNEIVP
jgi:hypothetical protein